MRLFSCISLFIMAVLFSAPSQAADLVTAPMLSYQGFTGILNTPSAHVSNEGSIHLSYSDQKENIWRADSNRRQENYLMNIGLFSFFELGGRLTEAPGRARDLSASLKVTSAPLTKDHPSWPVLAAGIQDVGGGANLLESRYLVVSEDIWRFRLSAGYGFNSTRMKSGFCGAEFQLHNWVTLLGEYDTKDTSAGIRVVSPEIWKTPVQLAATFKSALNHNPGNIDVAVGLTFPLDFRKKSRPVQLVTSDSNTNVKQNSDKVFSGTSVTAQASADSMTITNTTQKTSEVAIPSPVSSTKDTSTNAVFPEASENLGSLQKLLTGAGFINVRVGQRLSRELVVEYENTVYNHNELDALGVVAGMVSESASEKFETIHFVIKRKDIRVAVISVPRATLHTYMKQAGSVETLRKSMKFSYDTTLTEDTYFPSTSTPFFAFPETSLILAPGLQTYVGTEVGVFDYVLSLKPEIQSNLWKGAVFQARWDLPLVWSDNFDDGKYFRSSRNGPRMDRAMLFQVLKLAPGVMANLGGGMVLHGIYGTLNEVIWSPGYGAHRFRGLQAWTHNRQTDSNLTSYLGSYRYFFSPMDLSLEITAGRFLWQDRGFSLEMKRFFGDTAISALYKNSTTESGKHWQMAGVQFAFPLTPRKDYKIGPVVVRGTNEWAYSQETTLAIGGQKTNDVLNQALAINPQPTPALYHSYYNRDRLSRGYVEQNLERLREAWQKYGISAMQR